MRHFGRAFPVFVALLWGTKSGIECNFCMIAPTMMKSAMRHNETVGG